LTNIFPEPLKDMLSIKYRIKSSYFCAMPEALLKNTFSKNERLCKRTDIEFLLQQGQSFNRFPLRVTYITQKTSQPALLRIAISVPKRRIKKAVDRNRIKRLVREAFRLQKKKLIPFLKEKNQGMDILLVYTGDLNITFTVMQDKIMLILQRLKQVHERVGE